MFNASCGHIPSDSSTQAHSHLWYDHTGTQAHIQPDMTGYRTLKLEFLRLGFTFSKPSLKNLRSTWNPATRQAETEPQRLDFGPGNRASEARVATNAYCFKTGPTNWIVWFLWVFTHFQPFGYPLKKKWYYKLTKIVSFCLLNW